MQFSRLLAFVVLLGVTLILVGLFALPWVSFASVAEINRHVTDIQHDPSIQAILSRFPGLRSALGLELTLDSARIGQFFSDPQQQQVMTLALQGRQLTGWSLQRDVPQLSRGPSWGIVLALISAVLGLLSVLVGALTRSSAMVKSVQLISSIITLLSLLLLLAYLPRIDTFGRVDDLSLAFLCFLLGTETRAGAFVVLAGLAFAVIGLLLSFISTPATDGITDDNDRGFDAWAA